MEATVIREVRVMNKVLEEMEEKEEITTDMKAMIKLLVAARRRTRLRPRPLSSRI